MPSLNSGQAWEASYGVEVSSSPAFSPLVALGTADETAAMLAVFRSFPSAEVVRAALMRSEAPSSGLLRRLKLPIVFMEASRLPVHRSVPVTGMYADEEGRWLLGLGDLQSCFGSRSRTSSPVSSWPPVVLRSAMAGMFAINLVRLQRTSSLTSGF